MIFVYSVLKQAQISRATILASVLSVTERQPSFSLS